MARIEHFAVYSDDPTALKDFYVQTFGLQVIVESGGDPPGYFLADDQGMAIEVLGRPRDLRKSTSAGFVTWRSGSKTSSRKKSISSGSVSRSRPRPWSNNDQMKTAFFKDPGGNRCQIVWRRRELGKSVGRKLRPLPEQ